MVLLLTTQRRPEAAGPGWVPVGDAGHFKDPTPAQGISDALRQGERLAASIEAGLDRGGLQARLAEWWRWRDEDAWEMYGFATDMGAAEETPGIVAQMLGDLGRTSDGAERFLRVLNHQLAPSRLFTPGRALRSLARAGIRHPSRLPRLAAETATLGRTDRRRRRLRSKLPRLDEQERTGRVVTGGDRVLVLHVVEHPLPGADDGQETELPIGVGPCVAIEDLGSIGEAPSPPRS